MIDPISHYIDEQIAEVSWTHDLLNSLSDLTNEELAQAYCAYMDDLNITLLEGFMEEVYRRGISLTDLEDYCLG